jgi:hypothetical protein
MSALSPAFQLLLLMFAGWVNRQQLDVIDYLQEENRLRKERLCDRRIHFTDAERRRLARRAKASGLPLRSQIKHRQFNLGTSMQSAAGKLFAGRLENPLS